MARGRRDECDEEEEDLEEEEDEYAGGGRDGGRKRRRSDFIDDAAVEEDDEDEEEDDEEEDFGGRRGKHRKMSKFIDMEAEVDEEDDEEEEEEEGEDDFIVDGGAELRDEEDRTMHRRPSILMQREEDQLDVDELEQQLHERYARSGHIEYGEEATEVEQQAFLPSVKDPKLWMVKCRMGHEREAAICLMQKYIDKGSELHIRSAIALEHLENYIYVEADKEAHVKEACKGLSNIFIQKVQLVPIKEMTDVLSVESKSVDLTRDTWVRMKIGIYKGDLAKVMDVDNVRQRVTVKLIPRIDLQTIANKLEGKDVGKKRTFVPPPKFFNVEEAREMHIHVERRRDSNTGEYFEMVGSMALKDGFLYKSVSIKSISTQNIQPTLDELEKFRKPGDDADAELASLSTLFANRKKGHFMKGDAVIVVRGELKDLVGWVEKVEEENVHIRLKMQGQLETVAFNEKELCKYFEQGNHVKVNSGVQEGTTGMVVKVENRVLIILSDTTKEHIRVFADNVVKSSEITSGMTKIGDYELHDLVLLDNMSFGVIISVEKEAFQVLKDNPDKPDVVLVKLREIKNKIDRRGNALDRDKNPVSMKDIVRVVNGPSKGRQGLVEHMHRGILFIHDRHHLEHAGFICVKSQSCVVVGGSHGNRVRRDSMNSNFDYLRSSVLASPMRQPLGRPPIGGGRGRGGRGHDDLVGRTIKIRLGHFKGYRGRVTEVTGEHVRVELDSQMKIVTVKRDEIADTSSVSTPCRQTPRYVSGSETPMHPSRTPLHTYMTPMRDPGATPTRDGMRTPMHDHAWNPYAPMTPARDNWEGGNPASSGTSPQYQPGMPPIRSYEVPTPGSGWANTPGCSYSEPGTPRENSSYGNAPSPYLPSTSGGQPMTPNSSSDLPGTPGGQPMTPGNVGLDIMSPALGGEGEGSWYLPDTCVNVIRPGEEPRMGVVREVLPFPLTTGNRGYMVPNLIISTHPQQDGSCRVSLGPETLTAHPGELQVVQPKKSERIKILNGSHRGDTGKLISVDGPVGIVKLDVTLDVKVLGMTTLGPSASLFS